MHSGTVQSQREGRWYVPPVPLSQGKQSMVSRSTWRFARRFVGVLEWVQQNPEMTLFLEIIVLYSMYVYINIKLLFKTSLHIGNI